MKTHKHIFRLILLVVLAGMSLVPARAQVDTVYAGQTTPLKVVEFPADSYSWELYRDVTTGFNFALEPGNCPASDAFFVGGTSGSSVNVTWLKPGVYFFKVTARQTSGTNNLNIGQIVVIEAKPTAILALAPTEICVGGSAGLTITLTGTEPWSFNLQIRGPDSTYLQAFTGITAAQNPLTLPVGPLQTTDYTVIDLADSMDNQENPSNTVTLTVHPLPWSSRIYVRAVPPVPPILTLNPYQIDQVCKGAVRTYRINGEQNSTYFWRLTDPGGTDLALATPAGTPFTDTDSLGNPVYGTEVTIAWDRDPGSYTLEVIQTSDKGCQKSEVGTISVVPQPVVFAGNDITICSGAIVTLGESTAGNYASLLWTSSGDGIFTNSAEMHPDYQPGTADLAAGQFTLTLTALGGGYSGTCIDVSDSLVVNLLKTNVILTDPAPVCEPGTVDLTLPGITAGSDPALTFTYWTDALGTDTVHNPSAIGVSGTYYIRGESALGCTDIRPVTVTINPEPVLVITNPTPVTVPATVDLTAAAITAGSTPNITLTYWTDSLATAPLTDPSAVALGGTYYIRAETAAGCFAIRPVVVVVNLDYTFVVVHPASVCEPGSIDLTAASVTAGSTTGLAYTYWTDSLATLPLASPANVTISGTYYIQAEGLGGYRNIQPVTVTIEPTPDLLITQPVPVTEPATVDLTNPAITAGSTPGLTFTYWTDPAGTVALADPTAVAVSGTYYIRAESGAGCTDIQPVTVTIHEQQTLVITHPSAVCEPGSIDLTAPAITAGSSTGLTLTYWSDAAATIPIDDPTRIAIAGIYYIRAEGPHGFTDIQPVTVTIDPLPTLIITNPGAVIVPATVDLTDPAITAGSSTGLTLTYWTDPAGTNPLATPEAVAVSGTYYIRATTSTGCSVIEPVVVKVTVNIIFVVTHPAAICEPGTIDLTSGTITAGSTTGLTFTYWTDSLATVPLTNPTALSISGIYYVKAQEPEGFTQTLPVKVTIDPKPVLVINNPAAVYLPATVDLTDPAITAGSSANISLTYWNDASCSQPIANSTAVDVSGTYYIRAESSAGCIDIQPVIVTIHPAILFVITSPDAVCEPGTIDLTAPAVTAGSSAGLTFTYWTDAAGTQALADANAISATGTYYIRAEGPAGFTRTEPVQVTIDPKPVLVITDPAPVTEPATVDLTRADITQGSSANITLSYWTDAAGTQTLANPATVAVSGTYYIRAVTTAGCSDIQPVHAVINPAIRFLITQPAAVCEPGTIDLTAASVTAGSTAGLVFTYWTDAAGTQSLANPGAVSVAGTYYIRAEGPDGYSSILPVTAAIEPLPVLVITNPGIVFEPATVDLTDPAITAGSTPNVTLTYWTDDGAQNTLTNPSAVAEPGTYYIRAATAAGCVDIEPVVVQIRQKTRLYITHPEAVCEPATIDITLPAVTLGSTPGLTFTYWLDEGTTQPLTNPTAISVSGTYYIKGVGTDDYSLVRPVIVTIDPKPILIVHDPDPVYAPETVDITLPEITAGSTEGVTLTYWINSDGTGPLTNPTAVSVTGLYFIRAESEAGCFEIVPVSVRVRTVSTLIVTNPDAICAPASVDLTNPAVTAGSSMGLILTYWMDSLASNPLSDPKAVATSGTYYIRASGEDDYSAILPVVVTIHPEPVLIVTDPATAYDPATVDLAHPSITAGSSEGLSLTYWMDASLSQPVANARAVATSGTYYIRGESADGCVVVRPVIVRILSASTFLVTDPDPVCEPATVDITKPAITAGSAPGLTFSYWYDAAATSKHYTPKAINLSGTYYIRAEAPNGYTEVKAVHVTISPIPILNITDPTAVCAPATVDLTDPGILADSTTTGLKLTYWQDVSATIPLSHPEAVAIGGKYYIQGESDGGCLVIQPVIVTIHPEPKLVITDPPAACKPARVNLTSPSVTAGSSANLSLTYWKDSLARIVLVDADAIDRSGTFYIRAENQYGCFVIKPVEVKVIDSPKLNIIHPDAVCAPGTVDLTSPAIVAGSSPGLLYSYWTDPDCTIMLTNPSAVAVSGKYFIRASASGGCEVTGYVTVVINPAPVLVITDPAPVNEPATVDLTDPAITAGSTPDIVLSYWTDSLATNPLVNPEAIAVSGTYYIRAMNQEGCSTVKPVRVVIESLPHLYVSGVPAVCEPETINLTDSLITSGSTPGLVLTYWLDAKATKVLKEPKVVAASGTYYIKAEFKGKTIDIKPFTVTIHAQPDLVITNPRVGCEPAVVSITRPEITAGSSTGLSLTYWTDLQATEPLIHPEAISSSGTYYIRAENANGCSVIRPVIVSIGELPELVVNDPLEVCEPATIDLTAPAVTAGSTPDLILTYWMDSLATVSVATPESVTGGTYYIRGATADGCWVIKPVKAFIYEEVTLTTSPKDQIVLYPENAGFGVTATGSGLTYQWQVNNGSGFVNVSDNAIHAGSKTDSLMLTAPPVSMNGYKYRVVVTGTCSSVTSGEARLIVLKERFELLVTAEGIDKMYDGNTKATVTLHDNRQPGDSLFITYGNATFDTKNVGTGKPVFVDGIVVTGPDAVKYTYNKTTTTVADITPKPITVTATPGLQKLYGEADPLFTYSYEPELIKGDHFTGLLTRVPGENPGLYPILQGTLDLGSNYTIIYISNDFLITYMSQIYITIVSGNTKVYGDNDPELKFTYEPELEPGDTFTGQLSRVQGEDVGQYVITKGTLTASPKYDLVLIPSFFTITPKPITVTGVADIKEYDGTTTSDETPVVTPGFAFDDTGAFVQTYDTKHVGTGKTMTPSGKVNDGNDGMNYTVTYMPADLGIITPKPITGVFTAADKTYDGTITATIVTRDLEGAIRGDDVRYVGGTATFDTPTVGEDKLVSGFGFSITGADAGNYTVNDKATTKADILVLVVPTVLTVNSSTFTHFSDLVTLTATVYGGAPLANGPQAAKTVTFSIEGRVIRDNSNNAEIPLTIVGNDLVASITVSLLETTVTGSMVPGTKDAEALFNEENINYKLVPNPARASFDFKPGFNVLVYPNPSPGPITFKISVDVGALAVLELYADNGQLVARLFEGFISTSESKIITVELNLAQGIYRYRAMVGKEVQVGNVIIIGVF